MVSALVDKVRLDMDQYESTGDRQVLDHLLFQLELLQRHLVVAETDRDILQRLSHAVSAVNRMIDESLNVFPEVNACCVYTNNRGRPKLDVRKDQLMHLLSLKFTCPDIAMLLGVSLRTVRKRMTDYGISVSGLYSQMSDEDLDCAVSTLKEQYPNSGYRMMNGLLQQQGIRVHHARIRDSMQRVDPYGVSMRWQECVRRKQYNVTEPLALWHIDGNHKLIR